MDSESPDRNTEAAREREAGKESPEVLKTTLLEADKAARAVAGTVAEKDVDESAADTCKPAESEGSTTDSEPVISPVPAPPDKPEDSEEPEKETTRIESLYRRFRGEVVDRHRVLFAITWMEFVRRAKRPLLLFLIVSAWFTIILTCLIMLYFSKMLGDSLLGIYDVDNEEFTLDLFMIAYNFLSFSFLVLFAAFVGGKIFAQTFSDKTIVLYLTKPVSRTDFILSRFGVVALSLAFVSLIPIIIVYFLAVGMTFKSVSWLINNFWILGAVVGYGLLIVITLTNISLACSCMTKRVYWAMASIIIILTLSQALAFLINDMTGSDYGILITVWENLRVVGQVMFQQDLSYDVNWLFSLFALGLVNAVCFGFVFWKVSALEVE